VALVFASRPHSTAGGGASARREHQDHITADLRSLPVGEKFDSLRLYCRSRLATGPGRWRVIPEIKGRLRAENIREFRAASG